MRLAVVATAGIAVCAGSACSAPSPAPNPTTSPTTSEVSVAAVVTSKTNECNVNPYFARSGPVAFTASASGRVPVSISIFGPDQGAFTKRLARVRILRSGETKAINLTMTAGAYEIACESSGDTNRVRLTVL